MYWRPFMSKAKKTTPKKNIKRKISGWIPDLPDHRDILYKSVYKMPFFLPKKIDLRSNCSAVENQGELGSCTANALVGSLEFLEMKNGVKFCDMSRLFIYYNEREIEHSVDSDSGAMIRDGIKTLKKQGVCSEKSWPYNIAKFKKKPSPACFKEALNHQITSYQRLETVSQTKACLASGFPFVFGFTVYESFDTQIVEETGKVDMPKPDDYVLGGHAVMAVGYDDELKRFIVRNSWGKTWGRDGYFTMPYDYLADRNLSDDFWTIRSAEKM